MTVSGPDRASLPLLATIRYTSIYYCKIQIINSMGNNVHDVKANFTSGAIPAGMDGAVSLFDVRGNRKYLTPAERKSFLRAAEALPSEIRTFLLTLAFTGARISEVLSVTPDQLDVVDGVLVIESLKKRRRGIFRAIPIPTPLIFDLNHIASVTREARQTFLWPWCRTTAWQHVKACM